MKDRDDKRALVVPPCYQHKKSHTSRSNKPGIAHLANPIAHRAEETKLCVPNKHSAHTKIRWAEMNLPHIQGAEHLGPSATASLLSLVEQRAKVTSLRESETPVLAENRPIQKVDCERYLATTFTQTRYCSMYQILYCMPYNLSLNIIARYYSINNVCAVYTVVNIFYGVPYCTLNIYPSVFNG